jgi:hypothetical protein
MTDLSKSVKKKLRSLAGTAYERELSAELRTLKEDFTSWEAGKLNAFDLSDRIHEFHDGASRELWKAYDSKHFHFALARAIVNGIVTSGEAGPEVLEALRGELALARSND